MLWVGLAIVIVTFWLIYKNYEARLVLALSGLVMALLGQYLCGGMTVSAVQVTALDSWAQSCRPS